jgi:hypothetical protein
MLNIFPVRPNPNPFIFDINNLLKDFILNIYTYLIVS